MTEQEKLAEEYKNYRKQCGYEDPVALDEIEGAYYMGMLKQKDLIIKKAHEWLENNIEMYNAYNPTTESYYSGKERMLEDFKKAMEEEK